MYLICRPLTYSLIIVMVMCCCKLNTAQQPEICHDVIDLVFVVDQSESISENDPLGSPDHGWKAILTFISKLVDSFIVGPLYTRVALVKYSSQPVVMWQLDRYTNAVDLKQAIARLQHEGGNTNTAEALKKVRLEVLAANGNRPGARDVVVVLTDGLSTMGFKELPLQSVVLRGTGAELFVIAVGKERDETELRSMVYDFSRDIIHVDELPALPYHESLITHRLCKTRGPEPRPPSQECTPSIDLAFIIDNSGSIGEDNYAVLKEFLIQLTRQLDVTKLHKIGMVRFSDLTDIEFGLGQYQDRSDLENIITKAHFRDKETNTAAGLKTTTDHIFSGSSGDRPRVRNAALLIADGESNRNVERTQPEAERARRAGIELFVLGITDKINYRELKGIASDPDNQHFFDATDVRYLGPLIPRLIQAMCHS